MARITAVVILWIIIVINTSVNTTTKVLKVLLLVKVLSLALIVVGGCYWIATEGTDKLNNTFEGRSCRYIRTDELVKVDKNS